MTTRLIAPMTASALAWMLLAGCASNEPAAGPDAAPPAGMPGADAAPGEGDAASAPGELTEEQIELIRQLPAEDAELALVQKTCPVSDEPLGSMGVPIRVDLKDRAVYICCAGCKGEAEKNPDAILAKVPQGGPDLPSPAGR